MKWILKDILDVSYCKIIVVWLIFYLRFFLMYSKLWKKMILILKDI